MPVIPATSIDDIQLGTSQADTLNGGNVGDLIHGGAGNDTINGRQGTDVLFGDRGADTVAGNQGNDVLVWTNGDGSDIIDGGQGTDTLVVEGNANAGERFSLANDTFQRQGTGTFQLDLQRVETVDLQSLGGNDQFTVGNLSGSTISQVKFAGGDGSDELRAQGSSVQVVAEGENGSDRLIGGSGSDQLHGGQGTDTLQGNGGNDWLVGGAGTDTLNGGAGQDVLEGGTGSDRLNGGAGQDVFIFSQGGGDDTVQGFSKGNDVIALHGFSAPGGGPLTFADLGAAITEQGGDTTIDLGDFNNQGADPSITLVNVTGLTQQDFAFL